MSDRTCQYCHKGQVLIDNKFSFRCNHCGGTGKLPASLPVTANRVCTPTRNRQRIVEEVERRYGRKAGEMITFAPLVPVENVVAFVIDAVEAME